MSGTADSLTSLNQQIADAEALSSGTYTITLGGNIDYSTPIDAISLQSGVALTIVGQGDSLIASGTVAGLQVLGGSVTVENLTISGATAKGAAGSIGGGGGAA